ncbi:hypothetical protein K4H02_26635, partial [Mycobacterium tuberculosis]|nr:hypothetical protein [Mycobacterium tuberculosis]
IRIGDDAIIGANAVVLHDVPAGAVAVGNPARILERRRACPPGLAAPAASPTIGAFASTAWRTVQTASRAGRCVTTTSPWPV